MMEEVNATQAAVLSGYSERTIRRKIASGLLPARRIASNRFAIRVSDLPARNGGNALSERISALELRVHELDQQLQLLIAQEPAGRGFEEIPQEFGCDPARVVAATGAANRASGSTIHHA